MRIAKWLPLAALAFGTPGSAWAQAAGVTAFLLVRDADDRLLGRVVAAPDPQRVTVAMSVGGEIVFLAADRNALHAAARVYFTAAGCGGTPYFEAPACEQAAVALSGYDAADGSLYSPSSTIATETAVFSFLSEAGACTPTPGFQLPRGCEAVRHPAAVAAFTPPFAVVESTGLFCDGFESGDATCWSPAGGP